MKQNIKYNNSNYKIEINTYWKLIIITLYKMISDMLYEAYMYLPLYDQVRFSGLDKNCRDIWDGHFDKSLVNIYKVVNEMYKFDGFCNIFGNNHHQINLSALIFIKNNAHELKKSLTTLLFIKNKPYNFKKLRNTMDIKIKELRNTVELCEKYNFDFILHSVINKNIQCIDEYIDFSDANIVDVVELICRCGHTDLLEKYFTNNILKYFDNDDLKKCITGICKNNNANMLQYMIDVVGMKKINSIRILFQIESYPTVYINMSLVKILYDNGYQMKFSEEYINAGVYNNNIEFVKNLHNMNPQSIRLDEDLRLRLCREGWYDMIKFLYKNKNVQFDEECMFEAYKHNHMKVVDYFFEIGIKFNSDGEECLIKTYEDLEKRLENEMIDNFELVD
jgi:hypothetical protein